MTDFKQAPRTERDGGIGVRRAPDDSILIQCTDRGFSQSILCSDYNAARLFAVLAALLGVRLPAAIEKEIKL